MGRMHQVQTLAGQSGELYARQALCWSYEGHVWRPVLVELHAHALQLAKWTCIAQ